MKQPYLLDCLDKSGRRRCSAAPTSVKQRLSYSLSAKTEISKNNTRPYLVNLLDKSQQLVLNLLILGWLVAAFWFFHWWFKPQHFTDLWRFAFNSFIPLWTTFLTGYYFFFLRRMKKPNPALEIPKDWRVAMVVTRAPDEPFSLVQKMLLAMLTQDVPHDTWLADEDPTQEILDWCLVQGVQVSCRKGMQGYHNQDWPRREKCKEGNLAYFYDHYGYKDYDFVSQMDADHIPQPGYLRNMLRGFVDPRVGYVTAPSITDANAKKSWVARGRLFNESPWHGTLQAGTNNGFVSFCIGSHYAVRTVALKEAGGLGPELAEDHSTSFLLSAAGWKGVHSIDAEAHGQGPVCFVDAMIQEFQWARSLIMILVNWTPKYVGKLSRRMQFQFVFSQLWYFIYSASLIAAFSLAPLALILGLPFSNVTFLAYMGHDLVPLLLSVVVLIYIKHLGLLRPKNAPVLSWEQFCFLLARWPYVCWAVYDAFHVIILKKHLIWRVTPKEAAPGSIPFRYLSPYFGVAAISAGIALIRLGHTTQIGYFWLTLVNIANYTMLIWVINFLHSKESVPVPVKAVSKAEAVEAQLTLETV